MAGLRQAPSSSDDPRDPVRRKAMQDIPALRRRERRVFGAALVLLALVSALVVVEIRTVGNVVFPVAALVVMAVCAVGLLRSILLTERANRRLERDMTPPARERVPLEVRVVVMDMPSGAGGVWWTRVSLCEPGTRRALLISRFRGQGPAEVEGEPVTFHGRFVPGGNAVLEGPTAICSPCRSRCVPPCFGRAAGDASGSLGGCRPRLEVLPWRTSALEWGRALTSGRGVRASSPVRWGSSPAASRRGPSAGSSPHPG
ncbi:hypothetical protein GCM10027061_27580 [Nesterenkonia suensis]